MVAVSHPVPPSYGPLYTAVTTGQIDCVPLYHTVLLTHSRVTGFCGSLTTFSGWQVDVFDSWVNSGQFHRAGFRNASFSPIYGAFRFMLRS